MPLKVFISNIDKELGTELVELFRNDHVCLDNPNIIVGTASSNTDPNGIYRSINFKDNPNLALRAAMDSDLLILDIRQQSLDNELIIKYLAEATPRRNNRILAVSSFLTWANTTTPDSALSGESRQQVLVENCRPYVANQKMFRERLASWSALYQFELENLLIDMSLRRGFNVSIVTAGVQYGCTFDSFIGEFERGLNYGLPPICEGNGGNLMPMIHVKDLANMLFVLSQKKNNGDRLFSFAVDSSETTQKMLMDTFRQVLNVDKELTKSSGIVNNLHSEELQLNIIAHASPQLANIDWTCRGGLIKEKSRILEEFFTYRQYRFNQIELHPEQTHTKSIKETFGKLGYRLLDKQALMGCLDRIEKGQTCELSEDTSHQIAEEILAERKEFQERNLQSGGDKKKKADKEPALSYTYSRNIIHQAVEGILNHWKYSHRVVVLDTLFKQLIIELEAPNHRRVSISFESQHHQQPEDRSKIHTITFEGSEYKDLIGEKPSQQPTVVSDTADFNEAKLEDQVVQEHTDSPQIVNMKQYLIDNVMPAVTEAMVRIQQQRPPNIMNAFIRIIREIEARNTQGNNTSRKKKTEQAIPQ